MKELKLFEDSEVFTKKRPTISESQEKEFFRKFAEELVNSENEVEEYVEIIEKIFDATEDAYHLAKEFESEGFDVDMKFCNFLGDKQYEYTKIIRDNISTWIKAHNIIPKYKTGDKIIFKVDVFPYFKQNEITEINLSYPDYAKYSIKHSLIEWETIEEFTDLVNE
jgi:hypothetical protein